MSNRREIQRTSYILPTNMDGKRGTSPVRTRKISLKSKRKISRVLPSVTMENGDLTEVSRRKYIVQVVNAKRNIIQKPEKRFTTIVFLKTHKTGSSTILSILNRFADINNLEVALPFHPQILLGWPHKFKVAFVDKKRLKKGRADILCNHAKFSTREEFGKVVHPNAKFLTILRDPITRFESQFFFERFDRIFKLDNPSNPILEFHKDFVSLTSRGYGWRVANKLLLLRNGMLFDLTGINFLRTIYNKTDFNHHIKTINHIFDLVMTTEYFDESLVLLMKLLGWGMLDIVYMKKVVRNSTHSVLLTKETKTMISEQNKGDIELYRYFKDSFWKQVENYGKEFERDVEVFRKLNMEINTQCHQQKDTISANRLRRKLSDFGLDRNEWEMIGEIDDIDPCFCSKLHRNENEYLDYFWAKFPPYYYLPSVDKGKWLNC